MFYGSYFFLNLTKLFLIHRSYKYNVTTHFCWNNTVYDSAIYSLCNTTVYNRSEQFCFNQSLYDKNGKYEVCCSSIYDRFVYFCNDCKTYQIGFYNQCGKEIYYIKQKFCFNSCLFDRRLYEVCGTKVIKRSKYQCIENIIKERDESNAGVARKRELRENEADSTENRGKRKEKRSTETSDESISLLCQGLMYNWIG